MQAYIAKRLALAVPTLLLVSIFVFLLVRLTPGDVLMARIGESGFIPPDRLAAMRQELGLDNPLPVQFLHWFGGVVRGDLGESLWTDKSVAASLRQALEPTIELGILSLAVA